MKKPSLSLPNMTGLLKHGERLIGENAPTLLTVVGVAGVGVTAVLAAKASFQASDKLREEVEKRNINRTVGEERAVLTKSEKSLLVWTLYVPTVASAALSCGAIIGANRISGKRLAALGAAYAISERNFEDYKEKAKETLGINKEQKLRDEIAQDQVNAHPMSSSPVYVTGNGEYPCYDRYTAKYFKSNQQSLEQSINELNATMLRTGYVSLNDVYSNFGLDLPSHGDSMGWRTDGGLIELEFSTTRNDQGEPVLAYDFRPSPRPGYDMAH